MAASLISVKDHDRVSSDYSPLVSVRDFKVLVSRENFYRRDVDTQQPSDHVADIEAAIRFRGS